MKRPLLALLGVAALAVPTAARAETPSYSDAGDLVTGSGTGRADDKVYVPEMRFPMEEGPAFANSQVWGHGGGSGPKGTSQCDPANFSYPWRDNYCETRDWDMPLCPSGVGHQGQDVRAADCKKDIHRVVATADGTITNIGSYSLYLTSSDGTRFDYLHMSNIAVKEGDKVTRGQFLGMVSNQFGGTPTTVHLHFNIRQNISGVGTVFVPPYTSLIKAYDELLNPPAPAPAPTVEPEPEPAPPPEEPAQPAAEESGCACKSVPSSGSSLGALTAAIALALLAVRRRRA